MSHDHRYAARSQKANKIRAILEDFTGSKLAGLSCLDIGCSNGGISDNLAPAFMNMIAVDVDQNAIRAAEGQRKSSNLVYMSASGYDVPFPDESFDVIICAQVYEHVTDQQRLAGEVKRVIRRGGFCFFSGPNRLKVIEEHYWLPFLSWLPRTLSHRYMQLAGKGRYYDAYPLFYWQIQALWNGFIIHDYTPYLITQPERFSMGDQLRNYGWIKKLPAWLINSAAPFYPNYNWILERPA
jgi:ubiquinone/menaquinone biosynthesis C-methylase UbiE